MLIERYTVLYLLVGGGTPVIGGKDLRQYRRRLVLDTSQKTCASIGKIVNVHKSKDLLNLAQVFLTCAIAYHHSVFSNILAQVF